MAIVRLAVETISYGGEAPFPGLSFLPGKEASKPLGGEPRRALELLLSLSLSLQPGDSELPGRLAGSARRRGPPPAPPLKTQLPAEPAPSYFPFKGTDSGVICGALGPRGYFPGVLNASY